MLSVRPAFEFLCSASVGGLLSDVAVDLVVFAHAVSAFGLGDGSAVGVTQGVVLAVAPAGCDAGELIVAMWQRAVQVKQPYPGICLWRDPHGRLYLVDHTGTRKVGRTGPADVLSDLTIDVHPARLDVEAYYHRRDTA